MQPTTQHYLFQRRHLRCPLRSLPCFHNGLNVVLAISLEGDYQHCCNRQCDWRNISRQSLEAKSSETEKKEKGAWKAFAAGSAFANALFNFLRAILSVNSCALPITEANFTH